LFKTFHHHDFKKYLKKENICALFKFAFSSHEIVYQRYFQFESRKNWVHNVLLNEFGSKGAGEELNNQIFKKIETMKYCSLDILCGIDLDSIISHCDEFFKNFNHFIEMAYSTSSLSPLLELFEKYISSKEGIDSFIQYSNDILNSFKFLSRSFSFLGRIQDKTLGIIEFLINNEKTSKLVLTKLENEILQILLNSNFEEDHLLTSILVLNLDLPIIKKLKSKEFQKSENEKVLYLIQCIENKENFQDFTIKELTQKILSSKNSKEISNLYSKRSEQFLKFEEYENAISDSTISILLDELNVESYLVRSKAHFLLKQYPILSFGDLEDLPYDIESEKKLILQKMKQDILHHCQSKFGRIISKNEDDLVSSSFNGNEIYPLKVTFKTERQWNAFDENSKKLETTSETRICAWCDRIQTVKDKKFLLCGGCKSLRYCGKECQLNHWKHGHKFECKKE
jgi:hypothetical protein